MNLPNKPVMYMAVGLGLAGSSGYLAATALSLGSAQTPTKTVTIDLANGATGPQGPAGAEGPPGPAGPAGGGASDCPADSTFGKLVINHPGGHVSIYTCIVTE